MFGWWRRERQSRKRQRRALDLAREARDLREYAGGDRRPLGSWADLVSRDALTEPTRRLPIVRPLRGREPRRYVPPVPDRPVVQFSADQRPPRVTFDEGYGRPRDGGALVRPYAIHELPD